MSEVIVHRNIKDQIVDRLRSQVLAGELQSGQPLREQELAKRFGVSRGPIRDALLHLTQEGLLTAKPNHGVKVSDLPSDAIRPLIVSMRRQIEEFALKAIFDAVSKEQMQNWERHLTQFKKACRKGEMAAVIELDMQFHRSIVEAVGDDSLTSVWIPVVTRMMLPYSRHESLLESYEEHKAIVDAIRDGDKSRAVKNLKENIQ